MEAREFHRRLTEKDALYLGLLKNEDDEADYDGYERQRVSRSDFEISKYVIANKNQIAFPECTEGDGVIIRYFCFFEHSGDRLFSGPISDPILVSKWVKPLFIPYALKILDDVSFPCGRSM